MSLQQEQEIEQEVTANLPVGDIQQKLDVADMPDPDGESVQEEVKEKIKLWGKEFNSEQEAEEYVKAVERENLQVKAYNEGLLAATQKTQQEVNEAAPIDPLADVTEDEFWQNPRAALTKVYKKAKEDAIRETDQVVTQQNKIKQMWNDFYSANPDLQGREKYVKLVLEENWNQLQTLEITEAMNNLAMKTREELNMAGKPQKELTNRNKITPSGASKSVTPKEEQKKPLSMSEQIAKLRGQRGLAR